MANTWQISLVVLLLSPLAPAQKPLLVRDINPKTVANQSSNPGKPVRMGAFLYFAARQLGTDTQDMGSELFKSLGTRGTTRLVKDLWPGKLSGRPTKLTVVGSTLFFEASSNFQTGLWSSDGTAKGTVMVEKLTGVVGDKTVRLRCSPTSTCPAPAAWLPS